MLKVVLSAGLLAVASPVFGQPKTIDAPQPIGSAEYTFFKIPLYRSVLYTENGKPYSPNAPFALQLTYKRSVSLTQIVNATIVEIDRIHGAIADRDTLQSKLKSCFRPVNSGDVFIATRRTASTIDFHFNGRKTCTLNHPNIAADFFAIWLSDKSRSPKLSRALRGGT